MSSKEVGPIGRAIDSVFTGVVGLPPDLFCELIKLQLFYRRLKKNPEPDQEQVFKERVNEWREAVIKNTLENQIGS